jgi:copper oxidase (laccase) domain-containing protein
VLGEVSVVWVGPCIRSCCYEVGPEVIDGFEEAGLPVADDTHVDVMDAAAQAARSAGATKVVTADLCTSCEADLFFSHRRDGNTGRQGGFITRADGAL